MLYPVSLAIRQMHPWRGPVTALALIVLIALIAASRFLTLEHSDPGMRMAIPRILGDYEWRNMHFIGVGCIRNSQKEERDRVQANLNLLAGLWADAHFVIYADAESKEAWQGEMLAAGRSHAYHFLLDTFQDDNRIHRLIHGRNSLLRKARQIVSSQHFIENKTLVAVIDLDDMNTPTWKVETLVNAMQRMNEWDVVSFNRPYYYDIWALRYPAYDVNCWAPEVDNSKVIPEMRADVGRRLANESMFEVYSAFNGLAFYKFQFIQDCHYYNIEYDLDHPSLHLCIRNQGGRVRVFNETIINEFFEGPHRRLKSV